MPRQRSLRPMRRLVALLAAAPVAAMLLAPRPANGTSTLGCGADDGVLVFEMQAAVGYEALSVSSLHGELRLKREGLTAALSDGALLQHWIEGDELRLRFHLFAEAGRPEIDFVVVTRRRARSPFGASYAGRYRLYLGADRAIRSGLVTCGFG